MISFPQKRLRRYFKAKHEQKYSSSSKSEMQTLRGVMADGDSWERFKAHCDSEYSIENCLFWEECAAFKQSYESVRSWREIHLHATFIYERFLSAGCNLLINVRGGTAECVMEQLNESKNTRTPVSIEIFDAAESDVLKNLTDSFCRFLASELANEVNSDNEEQRSFLKSMLRPRSSRNSSRASSRNSSRTSSPASSRASSPIRASSSRASSSRASSRSSSQSSSRASSRNSSPERENQFGCSVRSSSRRPSSSRSSSRGLSPRRFFTRRRRTSEQKFRTFSHSIVLERNLSLPASDNRFNRRKSAGLLIAEKRTHILRVDEKPLNEPLVVKKPLLVIKRRSSIV